MVDILPEPVKITPPRDYYHSISPTMAVSKLCAEL